MIDDVNPNRQTTGEHVATGCSYGALANDEHAKIAVKNALAKIQQGTISGVLLFLSCGYSHKPQSAITEAVKAAGTPQVFGCCALGLLVDEEWLIDVEGAVAMIFTGENGLQPLKVMQQSGVNANTVLTLSTPNATMIAVNSCDIPQMGSISTDEYGHGPFSVWQSGRIVEKEFSHGAFSPKLNCITKVAESIQQLSPIMPINQADGHRLMTIDGIGAIDNLRQHLPDNLQSIGLEQPYSLLCAVSENTQIESIQNGHYKLQHIVANDEENGHIHLSGSVKNDKYMFWAIRDEKAAEENISNALISANQHLSEINAKAKFCLMFPNVGRGAEFYNGQDRDFELYKKIFPNLPMIGFYGNGEIAPGHKVAGLIHRYACVFSIFY